ncbi:sulfotransferase family 2 domain-containing protein [Microbulbifer guangxiensis]|uniref:sulfotransferase family 2 domain-containing protein n=1 Tax=Microbulbifer guangxiensis TaxID=2904249 RepID=UPI001F3EDD6C|nr:sulfotransferase family 2 domain-containing protein [Microbulbifer guangxiensis]
MRVLIYGLAKSGTTILAARVQASLEEHCGKKVANSFEPAEILRLDGEVEYLKGGKRQRSVENEVVKTLFDSGIPADEILKYQGHFDKKIFITRDPRDRYISQVFYRWHAGHNPDKNKFRRTLDLLKLKESRPDSVPFVFLANQNPSAFAGLRKGLAESYEPVIDFLKGLSNDWHVVRYEDIVDGRINDLASYLGFPIRHNVGVSKALTRVVRSKSYGNWRRWLTEHDVAYLKPAFQKYLEFTGYDADDWELDTVRSLPEKEGSAYIEKLFSGPQEYSKKYITIASRMKKNLFLLAARIAHSNIRYLHSNIRHSLFPRVAPAEPRLFLHIPKTAGTSFRESLRLSVGDLNIIKDYPKQRGHEKSLPYRFLTKIDDPSTLKQHLSKYRSAWVSGHVRYSRYCQVIPPENTFTFVRHPVDRLVSLYKHRCRHMGLKLSFEEFIDQEAVHNTQSKYLPLDLLHQFAFVGLTEEYAKSLEYLNWKFDLNLSEVKRNEAPIEQQVELDTDILNKIRQKNSEDLALYDAAQELFRKRILEMNSDYSKVQLAEV